MPRFYKLILISVTLLFNIAMRSLHFTCLIKYLSLKQNALYSRHML